MKRNVLIRYLLLIVLISLMCFFLTLIYKTYNSKREIEIRIQSLQHSCFQSMNGEQICIDDFDSNLPIIIIYFHPECEHCQYEAKEIGIHANEFFNKQLIMITPDDSIQRIKNFIFENQLWNVDNLEILLDQNNSFNKYFGTAKFPSIFVYKNKKLLKKHSGEIRIEALVDIVK